MAEKKKGKKRKEEYIHPGEEVVEKPTKEEYTVAKWMRKNVPIKKTKLINHNVKYFTASRAIDALLTPTSPWSLSESSTPPTPHFQTRDDVVDFLHRMLEHKFFHRARKVPISDQELAQIRGGSFAAPEKKKPPPAKDENKGTDAESSTVPDGTTATVEKEKEKERRKRKIRLDMHNDQRFIDSLDAYVWIYDPIPLHYWLMGAAFVLGAIGLCLFPLWPPSVRLGVYYLSVAAAGFLVFIILLVVLRLIMFCAVWMATMGKHHLWILPNLTEDVGFFASFWPLYKHEYKGAVGANGKKSKKKKKDKDSDAEDNGGGGDSTKLLLGDEGAVKQTEDERLNGDSQTTKATHLSPASSGPATEVHSSATSSTTTISAVQVNSNNSESESESSQRSSTGKDFEMVEEGDLDEEGEDEEGEDEEEEDDDDVEVEKRKIAS